MYNKQATAHTMNQDDWSRQLPAHRCQRCVDLSLSLHIPQHQWTWGM